MKNSSSRSHSSKDQSHLAHLNIIKKKRCYLICWTLTVKIFFVKKMKLTFEKLFWRLKNCIFLEFGVKICKIKINSYMNFFFIFSDAKIYSSGHQFAYIFSRQFCILEQKKMNKPFLIKCGFFVICNSFLIWFKENNLFVSLPMVKVFQLHSALFIFNF